MVWCLIVTEYFMMICTNRGCLINGGAVSAAPSGDLMTVTVVLLEPICYAILGFSSAEHQRKTE